MNKLRSIWKNNAAGRISGITISSRLLICFLASTLIPAILITGLLCLHYDRSYRRTALEQMQVSRNLIGEYIKSYFSEVNTITTAPYYHSYFSSAQILDPSAPDYPQKLSDFQTEMQNLINLTTYSHTDIADLLIWSDGQYLFFSPLYNELWYFSNRMVVEEQPWYAHALDGNGRMVFTPTYPRPDSDHSSEAIYDTSSFYVTRYIHNIYRPDQINLMILNLTSRSFDAQLKDFHLLYDSFVVITNEYGDLIYSSKPLTIDALDNIQNEEEFLYDRSRWNCISSDVPDFPLRLHVVFSLDDIRQQTLSLIFYAAQIYLLGMLLAMVLFYIFNKWITRSARTLLATFSELEQGNLEITCPSVDVKEFNQIGSSINDMIAKLNEKIKNEYLLTIQQKSLQLHALQSQIQPHFMVNTIYGFIALNQIGDTQKLNDGLYNLAYMLRYVLSRERFTTIGQEQAFLERYLSLQRLRFGDRLSYQLDCPQELRGIQLPRLLLQPLVENAVIHGIEPCEHSCLCRVAVSRQETNLHILVEDNGIGIPPKTLSHLLESRENDFTAATSRDEKTSIGLSYVKERLHMWSARGTLHIDSRETTRVEIQIPWEEVRYEPVDCG